MKLFRKIFPILVFTFFGCLTHNGYTIRPLEDGDLQRLREMRSQQPSSHLPRLFQVAKCLAEIGEIGSFFNMAELKLRGMPENCRGMLSTLKLDLNVASAVHEVIHDYSIPKGLPYVVNLLDTLISDSERLRLDKEVSIEHVTHGLSERLQSEMNIPKWDNTLPKGIEGISEEEFSTFSRQAVMLIAQLIPPEDKGSFFSSLARAKDYTRLHEILERFAVTMIPFGPLKNYVLKNEEKNRQQQYAFALPLLAFLAHYNSAIQENFPEEPSLFDVKKLTTTGSLIEALEEGIENFHTIALKIRNVLESVKFSVRPSTRSDLPCGEDISFLQESPNRELVASMPAPKNFFLRVARVVSVVTGSPRKISKKPEEVFYIGSDERLGCVDDTFTLLAIACMGMAEENSAIFDNLQRFLQKMHDGLLESLKHDSDLKQSYIKAVEKHSLQNILVCWGKECSGLKELDTLVDYILCLNKDLSPEKRKALESCFEKLAGKDCLYTDDVRQSPNHLPKREIAVLDCLRKPSLLSWFYVLTPEKTVKKIEASVEK